MNNTKALKALSCKNIIENGITSADASFKFKNKRSSVKLI
jgi:hypothetical protein